MGWLRANNVKSIVGKGYRTSSTKEKKGSEMRRIEGPGVLKEDVVFTRGEEFRGTRRGCGVY